MPLTKQPVCFIIILIQITYTRSRIQMKKYDRVLWDWNGTLLDDLDMNYEVMKTMLFKTGKNTFPSKDFYLENFAFPIINFYKLLGFDFESRSFEEAAVEYVSEYEKRLPGTKLFENTEKTLKILADNGIKQAVISATGHERLTSQVGRFKIKEYFDAGKFFPNKPIKEKNVWQSRI